MSTNKTENYRLHTWEPGDNFLLSEINENFAILDGAAWIVAGSYMGDGASGREIVLGFSPKAVIFCNRAGQMGYASAHTLTAGGIILPDCPVEGSPSGKAAELTEQGFKLYHASYNPVNGGGTRYHYLALR